ncbi:Fur family transcriptional regulator [Pedobacter jamesrossensis]|uniref:Fur family transcriptional regulator n=1 Tax=Pedobacter jamesrossensis TaxID=1908238 RepID=A0ABV8NMX0_9SPHI
MNIGDEHYGKLLDKYNLKKTKTRLSVLEILDSSETAVSQPILEKTLGKDTDRVTLYRVLKSFEDKCIIHKIIDKNGTSFYALCDSIDHLHQDHEMHVHFNCVVCLKVYCVDDLKLPHMPLPKGFTESSKSLVIYGTCEVCNKAALLYAGDKISES